MRPLRIGPIVLGTFAFSLLQLVMPSGAFGQAWVPGKGWGNVSIGYKNLYVKDHLDVLGNASDKGQIRSNVLAMDLDYGVTRRLAVNAGLPLSMVKYTGTAPHIAEGIKVLDDGTYHGGFQDFRFGLRYNLVRSGPITLTPFAEGIVPSHDYVTFAHAAEGRGLRELLVGTNIGWQGGESFLPNAFAQVRINYSFVQKVLDRSHNRTNIDAEAGYFVTPRLAVTGIVSYAKHHGGLDYDSSKGLDQWTHDELINHDELMRSNQLDAGAGAAFLLSKSVSVYGNYLTIVSGINGHALNSGVIVGINFRFRSRRPHVSESFSEPEIPKSSSVISSIIPPIWQSDVLLRACH